MSNVKAITSLISEIWLATERQTDRQKLGSFTLQFAVALQTKRPTVVASLMLITCVAVEIIQRCMFSQCRPTVPCVVSLDYASGEVIRSCIGS